MLQKLEKGKLTPEDINEELKKIIGEGLDLSAFRKQK